MFFHFLDMSPIILQEYITTSWAYPITASASSAMLHNWQVTEAPPQFFQGKGDGGVDG